MAQPDSEAEAKLTNILADLKTYVESNPIEPANKKNRFRYEHISKLKIYDEIVNNKNPLELLHDFFTPNNIFDILSGIQLEKRKIDCFTARNVYNLIEKVYIRSWISGIMAYHPRNYKIMALGAYTIRAVMRVVIRELITVKSGEHSGIIDGIIDTIGDCKSINAYTRDASLYEGTCRTNYENYLKSSDDFLNDYHPTHDNCPDINDLLKRKKMTMNTADNDPKWLSIVEGAIGTNAFYNFTADAAGTVFHRIPAQVSRLSKPALRLFGFKTSPDSPDKTPVKYISKEKKSKGRKIVSKVLKKYKRSTISGGRKTIKRKHRKHRASKKYIK